MAIGDQDSDEGTGVSTISRTEVKKPKLYKVIMHNDDYTTMEFVIFCLQNFFGKTYEQAEQLMMQIHTEGAAVCGVFTFEIAEAKAEKVMKSAEREGHPLRCSVEGE